MRRGSFFVLPLLRFALGVGAIYGGLCVRGDIGIVGAGFLLGDVAA